VTSPAADKASEKGEKTEEEKAVAAKKKKITKYMVIQMG